MSIWTIIPLVSFVVCTALFAFVARHAKQWAQTVFVFYLILASLWSLISFLLHLNAFPQYAITLNNILTITLIWMTISYYHFIRSYSSKPGGIGVYFGYAFLIATVALAATGNLVKSSYVTNGVLTFDLGSTLYFIVGTTTIFIGLIFFSLVQRYRSSTDPIDRNRTMYLIIAASIVVIFGFTNTIPAVAGLSLDHLGNFLNAMIITYAILMYQLLNIRFVVRRGLAYLLVIICLGGIYTGAVLLGHRLFPDQALYSVLLLASGLALLLALLARPLRYVIQERVDRFFYGETYDYRRTLLSFSRKMGNILNLNELASGMLPAVAKALHITRAKLLFEDVDSGDFTTQFTYPEAEGESSGELRFNADNPIIAWLVKENTPLSLEQIDSIPQFKGLWQTEREKLVTSNLELLCPIKSRGKLIGILALGRKESDTLYTHDDIELVMSMASQAGILIENARMFDSLKNEQLRVRQLLAQAVHAQEEERKRISVDLHDGVAQWLVAASYRAQTCNELLSGRDNDEARGELDAMESTIDKSLKELRRVVTGLRPPALDELGLNHALRQSLEDLKTGGLDCQFSEVGTPVRLPSSMEIAVYRLVQEALANVRRHANATKVYLRLQFHADKLLVEVRDNGRGFDLSRTLDSAISVGHMGLLGMKQRAETLGGDIKIKTGEGIGTTIILSLPIQPQVEER